MTVEREQHPTLPDWQLERYQTGEQFILHGFRPDTPAALPLITASGSSSVTASQRFMIQAKRWDEHAQVPHRIVRPKR